MPTLAEIAAGVGTAVGSGLAAYLLTRRSREKKKDEAPPSGSEKKDGRAAMIAAVALGERMAVVERRLDDVERRLREDDRASMPALLGDQIQRDIDELRRDMKAVHRELGGFLTVEEFRAYAQMDSGKREALIEKLAEYRGHVDGILARVDVILRDMRRYER